MSTLLFSALFFLTAFCSASPVCFFTPPPNWECAHPKTLSKYVQVGFLGPSEKGFRPSLNFATEETNVSLKEYIKAVRKIHEEMGMPWTDLGEFSCQAGKGRLAEIISPSPTGTVKMLQMILVKEGKAYILTGASLAEEFASHRSTLLTAIRSIAYAADLFDPIADIRQRNRLKESFSKISASEQKDQQWEKLQKEVGELSSLSPHWQFLALQEGHQKIFGKNQRAQ